MGYLRAIGTLTAAAAASVVLLVFAKDYWWLYAGSFLNGLAAGTVEAVINPVVASMFPKNKTKMLTILHAGWPGGFVLGGLVLRIGDWRYDKSLRTRLKVAHGQLRERGDRGLEVGVAS